MWGATEEKRAQVQVRCFNPRAPCGARQVLQECAALDNSFNPRAPCGARHRDSGSFREHQVSIHAPRVGRDIALNSGSFRSIEFQSTRPVWGATETCRSSARPPRFQSTRPVWGATIRKARSICTLRCFNPRAPCGARRSKRGKLTLIVCFNPRAPCGARHRSLSIAEIEEFQSTRPVWGATGMRVTCKCHLMFQSTRPCGARVAVVNGSASNRFNPRAPCGARQPWRPSLAYVRVSIHAPRVGRDVVGLPVR